MQRRHFIQATGAGAAVLALPALRAQSWPSGPIRIVVGFPPGGGADALARVVGLKLSALWNQPVVIENKAGASGTLAAEYVAQQASDGTTLLLTTINSHALAPAVLPKLRYHPERDFVPVALLGLTPNLLIAGAVQPARTVKDLVALCKAKPGVVTFGSAGPGTAQHFALELFKLRARVDALHVPYKGSGPLLTDLVGGQIQYSFETMTAATPHVKSGRAIAVAQTRSKRVKAYPDVPTMQEQGFAGFETFNWYGISGSGKLPAPIASRMNKDINTVLAMADVREKFDAFGVEDGGGSPEKFAELVRSEIAKWAKVAQEANVRVDG
ncbi:Bug family tripartite tricarboxylate transporter substrate binding protein [Polaromonas sp. JS666]|uniref:Bug family tripartite tricarboxylate transporter substrate binding protein n=1 Tax=Polaromonas sp. (strain JS666 / ATCC BAA-500) TaxID=296591 RepID=UPI0000464F0F|nr:tripartite tricarboxylate transporter substrate binding protein [Polaromonas sp. JS666]ABE42520.1 Twin-arginine translocation pathway signal [Polaromonas sp. JS666]